ncbi:MAG: family 43 glycosylhydrolase [Eubacterium sp.]|nr:family 43 glycosylhydrolase [Eubacterium sp.]
MSKLICNPLNINYKYQFIEVKRPVTDGKKLIGVEVAQRCVVREAADPSVVLFKGKYYLFPSMSKGFWVSDNMADWKYVSLKNTPSYDYAPDVCVVGDYIYFCASKQNEPCKFYRSKNPLDGVFEEVATAFPFYDPALFRDDDGKTYFYWGCTNTNPIYGAQLNPETMQKIGEDVSIVYGNEKEHGFERIGDDHVLPELPPDASDYEKFMRMYIGTAPFIEGAWMNKFGGKYYLQYAAPATEYNVYADGVYVSDNPLTGFKYAENNPYSYKPGGFITGAGHGSTFEDKYGNLWHASTMRISVGHKFERRVGIFPAGIDKDGELFCNQRYGDFPLSLEDKKIDPWKEPEYFLLSYGKKASASSEAINHSAQLATDENIRSWWKADESDKSPWLKVDLGGIYSVSAIQINFADELEGQPIPENTDALLEDFQSRYIEDKPTKTRWLLEGSTDDRNYFIITDKTNVETDLPHDLIEIKAQLRYVRLTVKELPYNQTAAVSGLRVFGKGNGNNPDKSEIITAERCGDLEAFISWKGNAVGYTVLWGHSPEKLYHSYTVYGATELTLRALNKGQKTWVRIDGFNESGITHGEVQVIK